MPNPIFEKYWQLRMDGVSLRLKAAQELIEHSPTRGTISENLLKDLLGEFLPQRWGIAGGFLTDPNGTQSRQIDVLIFDLFSSAPLYRDGGLAVLSPDMASVCIEVKSTLDKPRLEEALENVASVKALNPNAHTIIFAFRGMTARTLEKHLTSLKTAGVVAASLPDRVIVFNRALFIVQENGTFRAYRTMGAIGGYLIAEVLQPLKIVNLQAYIDAVTFGKQVFTV